jgi:hypothetical protein
MMTTGTPGTEAPDTEAPDTEVDSLNTESEGSEQLLDMKALEREIALGAKAFDKLLHSADSDWTNWSAVIVGLRGLRTLAFEKGGVSDIRSWHYRDALSDLLQLKKYAIYDRIGKQTRSVCYKLMDSIEDINTWHATLPIEDRMRWKHPEAIAKHCPPEYVDGGRGHNQPKKVRKAKKPQTTAREERMRQAIIMLLKRLAKYEPESTDEFFDLLREIEAEPELNDSAEDI